MYSLNAEHIFQNLTSQSHSKTMICSLLLAPLFAVRAASINIVSEDRYSLVAREIGTAEDAQTVPLGELNINESLFKSSSETPSTPNSWCLDLEIDGNVLLPCFQFYNGSLSGLRNGELFIELDNEGVVKEISLNINNNLQGLEVNIATTAIIQSPALRYKSNKPNGDKKQYDAPKKKKSALKGPLGADLPPVGDSGSNEFNEVVIPARDGKTFIERHWKFIVPPLVILFVMSYFAESPDGAAVAATTESEATKED